MTAFERELVENGCEMQDMVKRLQKENAELRECLKEALDVTCDGCRHAVWSNLKFVRCKRHKNLKCPFGTERWLTALEGGNHAND